MSAPTRKRQWLTLCTLAVSAALVATPAGAAVGKTKRPFGPRTLAQLAAEREKSVGTMSPKVKGEDGDDGNEADEIAEGADQYA